MHDTRNVTEQIRATIQERLGNAFLGVSAKEEVKEMIEARDFLEELASASTCPPNGSPHPTLTS